MNAWSWVFFFGFLSCLPTAFSTLVEDPSSLEHPSRDVSLVPRTLHVEHSKVIGPIIGGVLGGIILLGAMVFLFLRLNRKQRQSGLEDGLVTPQLSGRQWYTRFNRSGKDAKSRSEEKTPYSGKTGDLIDEAPMSAVPRYLKADLSFDLPSSDRPMPPSPAHPRSPRAHTSGKGKSLTLTVPSPSPTGRSPTGRSPSRRKVPVASQPVVVNNNGFGSTPNSASRKRTLLPNIFRQRPADRNPRIPPGFEQAYPSDFGHRNPRSAPNTAGLQSPNTPRSGSDMSIEDDIADLPVKTPRMRLPRGDKVERI